MTRLPGYEPLAAADDGHLHHRWVGAVPGRRLLVSNIGWSAAANPSRQRASEEVDRAHEDRRLRQAGPRHLVGEEAPSTGTPWTVL